MSSDTGLGGGGGSGGGTSGAGANGVPLPTGSAAGSGGDWAKLLTEKVESLVSLIRDRTVTPVFKAVRYIIFGLIALAVGSVLAIVFAVLAVRVLDDYLFHSRVWASYLVLAGIFAALGLFLSWRRHPRT